MLVDSRTLIAKVQRLVKYASGETCSRESVRMKKKIYKSKCWIPLFLFCFLSDGSPAQW